MNISFCMLILTFFVYFDFVELSFHGNPPAEDQPPLKLLFRRRKQPSATHSSPGPSSSGQSSQNVEWDVTFQSPPRREVSPPPQNYQRRERFRSRSPPVERSPDRTSLATYPPDRVMVPPTRLPSNDGRGYQLTEMKFLRIKSSTYPQRIFEFGRYTFPRNTTAKLRTIINKYVPPPLNEQIVIFTSEGDIYAMLETDQNLAGLYVFYQNRKPRAKINMQTHIVTPLPSDETSKVPIGRVRTIALDYVISKIQVE